MCGICGKFSFPSQPPPSQDLIQKMAQKMIHRGPDEEGYFFEGRVGLGHRRLKVIDPETGTQPIVSACSTGVIVYNGEVYNFPQLREELEARGRKFKTKSDAEVVLNAYLEWGLEFLGRLRGVFAFAIYDRSEQSLLLVRDRFGVKPLYYFQGKGGVSFASELKALLCEPEIERRLDPVAIYQYFISLYIPSPRSGVLGVNKLPAGHFLYLKDEQVILARYYQLPELKESKAPDFSQACEEVFEEIERAVSEELVSDVPIGVFLSGGLDSSTVTTACLKGAKAKIKAYTVGFEEERWDETRWAREVAQSLGAEHQILYNRAEDLEDLLDKIIWHFDEPHGNYTAVANYLLCQACRSEIVVALAGSGGDEVFAGYQHHLADKLIAYYYRLVPGFLRKKALMPLFNRLSSSDQIPGWRRRFARALGFEEPDLVLRHLRFITLGGFYHWLEQGQLIDFSNLAPEERKEHNPYLQLARFAWEYPGEDKFNALLWLDINTYLNEDILMMTDRMSMANSLEVRVPLLDHKLVEKVFSLPFSYKLPGLDKKYILKGYLLNYLSRKLVYRPKQGFGIPLQLWIKDRLRDFFLELFQGELARKEDFIDMKLAQKILKEHQEQGRDHTSRIWMIAHYLLWKEKFRIS